MYIKTAIVFASLMFAAFSNNAQVTPTEGSNYQINYEFKFQRNKTDTTSAVTEGMVLNINATASSFLSYNKLLKDSAMKQMEMSGRFDFRGVPKPKLDYLITKDRTANVIQYSHIVGVNKVYYTEALNLFDWQLHPEKKEIQGYACNKATVDFAGRSYTAWYTTAIPIAEGPYKFNGLPGLILEIYDAQNHFRFTLQGIKTIPFKNIDTAPLANYVKMTRKEYRSFLDKIKDNPALLFETEKMKLPPEMLEKAVANAKAMTEKDNNPLEIF